MQVQDQTTTNLKQQIKDKLNAMKSNTNNCKIDQSNNLTNSKVKNIINNTKIKQLSQIKQQQPLKIQNNSNSQKDFNNIRSAVMKAINSQPKEDKNENQNEDQNDMMDQDDYNGNNSMVKMQEQENMRRPGRPKGSLKRANLPKRRSERPRTGRYLSQQGSMGAMLRPVGKEILPPEKSEVRFTKRIQNGILNLNLSSLYELVKLCVKQRLIRQQVGHNFLVNYGIKQFKQFIDMFTKDQLKKYNFRKCHICLFDHRRLTNMLIDNKPNKYKLEGQPYDIIHEGRTFLRSLYAMQNAQYRQLCDKMRTKYHLTWWNQTPNQDNKNIEEIRDGGKRTFDQLIHQIAQNVLKTKKQKTNQNKSQEIQSNFNKVIPKLQRIQDDNLNNSILNGTLLNKNNNSNNNNTSQYEIQKLSQLRLERLPGQTEQQIYHGVSKESLIYQNNNNQRNNQQNKQQFRIGSQQLQCQAKTRLEQELKKLELLKEQNIQQSQQFNNQIIFNNQTILNNQSLLNNSSQQLLNHSSQINNQLQQLNNQERLLSNSLQQSNNEIHQLNNSLLQSNTESQQLNTESQQLNNSLQQSNNESQSNNNNNNNSINNTLQQHNDTELNKNEQVSSEKLNQECEKNLSKVSQKQLKQKEKRKREEEQDVNENENQIKLEVFKLEDLNNSTKKIKKQ